MTLSTTIIFILYYAISVALSFVTKWFLSKEGYDFRYPIFKSTITNLAHYLGAIIYIKMNNNSAVNIIENNFVENNFIEHNNTETVKKNIKGNNIIDNNIENIIDKNDAINNKNDAINNNTDSINNNTDNTDNDNRTNLRNNLICSIIGAIDISISMTVLRNVKLSFYTILKATSPVFILLSGFLLGVESISPISFISIVMIAVGTYFVVNKPGTVSDKNVYVLVISALISGLRWTLIQKVLNRKNTGENNQNNQSENNQNDDIQNNQSEKNSEIKSTAKKRNKMSNSNIMNTIKNICLPTSFFLFIISGFKENLKDILSSEFFNNPKSAIFNFSFCIVLGFCSFIMLYLELWIVKNTSVLFLSLTGIFKELLIVGVSIIRGDSCMSIMNYIGLVCSLIGLFLYNFMRYYSKS